VNDAWSKVSAWISSNGGYVNPRIRAKVTSHSGFQVRGIVSGETTATGQPILHVPKKLWLTLDKFPDIYNASLAQLPHCSFPLNVKHLNLVKNAGALAREYKKGNASFYHAYFSSLPTLDDFRLFHPRFMKDDVREDFAGLPMTAIASDLQRFDAKLRDCFLSWAKAPGSPVAGISVEDFEFAQTQFRTRAFNTGGDSPSLVPGADLLNTDRPVKLNTRWYVKDDKFRLDTTIGGTESGVELYDEYCKPCDNTMMMSIWGLYLEGNENPLTTRGAATCNAQIHATQPHKHGKFKSLREAAEAMLDLDDVNAAGKERRTSPRCRKEVLSLDQGPLRCSLARLAFEHCLQEWGYLGSLVPESAFFHHRSQFNASGMAELVSISFIHAVHPTLSSSAQSFRNNLRKGQRIGIG